jgi:hypothetical protein
LFSNSLSPIPSGTQISEMKWVLPLSGFRKSCRRVPDFPSVPSSYTLLLTWTPATCHLFQFLELEPPFDNPLYFRFSGIGSSKLSTLTLCHYDPRIPEPRFAEMSKHTSSISFAFHDFGTSDVECSAPCQRECRKPDSQNPDKYSIATSDFRLSSLLSPDHPSSGLPKPQLRSSEFPNSSLFDFTHETSFRVSGT